MVPEGVIHVAIEACYPLDRVREALVHAGRLGGPARSCFCPIWGCWMPRATVFLTQPCSSPLPRRSEPPDRWVLVGLIPCSTRHTSLFRDERSLFLSFEYPDLILAFFAVRQRYCERTWPFGPS